MNTKVAIITGAGSGIGKALALAFGKEGYAIVLNGRDADKLNVVSNELILLKIKCITITADVSIEKDCMRLIDETIANFGRLDILLNNAGVSMRALFQDVDLNVLRRVMDINFWGTVYCSKFALPHLLKSQGSIVGISSIAGKKGLPGRAGYSASKFAMEGFLETIRTENLKNNLHVLVACPGFTASNIRNTAFAANGDVQGESPRDEQKMMSADEVANHILLAVKKRKRDLILTANGKLTVFLNKFFPSLMDTIVYKHMAKEPGSPFK